MIWTKVKIYTNEEAEDVVSSELFDLGICGIEIDDNKNLTEEELSEQYIDIPVLKVDDGKAVVSFYIVKTKNESEKQEYLRQVEKNKNIDKNVVDSSYFMTDYNVYTEDEFIVLKNDIRDNLDSYKDFMDMGTLEIVEETIDDKSFLEKWKENFKEIHIGKFTIKPCLVDNVENFTHSEFDENEILINPGSAFGTGSHATTKLCVEALEKLTNDADFFVNDKNFLDIGCGSGILSIVAYKLGFSNINMIDIDEHTEINIKDNLIINDIKYESLGIINDTHNYDKEIIKSKVNEKGKIKYCFGNVIVDEICQEVLGNIKYDVIVANILAPVIISIISKMKVSEYLNAGGYFICSGIIEDMKDKVLEVFNNSNAFDIVAVNNEGEWVQILARVK